MMQDKDLIAMARGECEVVQRNRHSRPARRFLAQHPISRSEMSRIRANRMSKIYSARLLTWIPLADVPDGTVEGRSGLRKWIADRSRHYGQTASCPSKKQYTGFHDAPLCER
jgi:hypothetical protein